MTSKLLIIATILAISAIPARASSHSNDRASIGTDITVSEGETVGDVACMFCSVHVRGDVHGDVAVLFGSIIVDHDRSISGDVAVLGGDVSVADNASIGGDLALAAGDLKLSPEASVRGDRSVLSGGVWLLLPLAPLLVLIGVIWLIVYFIRRMRYRAPYYPSRRQL